MADFIKTKVKATVAAVKEKDWPAVEKHANAVLSFESGNYNARVFLALALFNLERYDEAEENYKKAIEGAPSQALARQGLASFYEKRQRWGDYAWSLLELMQLFKDAQDAPKYAETLQKLIEVRRSHGTRPELIDVLALLLPSSSTYPLLATLPEAEPTKPLASPYHAIQVAIRSPLSPLLELVSLAEAEESQIIEAEIKKRRQRLGGQTLSASETRRAVEGEYMRSSRLPSLYRSLLDEPDASGDEELRRDVEKKLLIHLRTFLRSLPSSFDETSLDLRKGEKKKEVKDEEDRLKAQVRGDVEELARGMVIVGVPEESAWGVALEWQDRYGEWEKVDWRELERYSGLFPETGLARIATASRQRVLARQPVDDDKEPPSAPDEDEMTSIIESGLVSSPDSIIAHLLADHFFAEQKEWDAVVQVAEAGLSVLGRCESEIGRALPSSRRTLESHLAIGLVYLDPPSHHLRALRLLESLITASPSPAPALLVAKAQALQSTEKWLPAVAIWEQVLAAPSTTEDARIEARGERAWSLFHAGELEAAREGLEEVVKALEERKKVRDEEQRIREKARSKAGVERGEGVEEGETSVEAEERAKSWYRLGECLWELGETQVELSNVAYDAFLSSIRAKGAFAPPWTSLGIYYRSLEEPDFDRASKCFQKAFELDGAQEVAAKYLAEEFALIHEWSLVEVIARRVVDGNTGKAALGGKAAKRLTWAYKAIGGSELNSKRYPQAIIAFQSALRGEPGDTHTWIKLGVAYRGSGKFIAALKVFARALELDPTSWYAQFSIGDVQREIGLLQPALDTFRTILEDRPDELGVKVVLAETALAAGLEQYREGFVVRAEESLVEALEVAAGIIDGGSATRIAWKVAGDAFTAISKIPEPASFIKSKEVALRILAVVEQQEVDSKIDGMSAVTVSMIKPLLANASSTAIFNAVAVLAFKMRVLLETQNKAAIGSAWFDLAVAISALRPHLNSLSLPITADVALHQAIRAMKFALHKEPVNAIFWNALGVLSFDLSPRLAQHCFIKSISYNSRSAVPWTNLGLFYLVHSDEDLANQSFLKAQVIDPDWAAAWVGQATLADMAGHAAEASVLLEHAFTLGGTEPEADIGFATRSFVKYRDEAEASAPTAGSVKAAPAASLSAPLFALTRYLSQRPDDVAGLHLYALMLEQVGDLQAASEALEKAGRLLEELYEVDESPDVEGQFVIAQTNLGRVRLASEDYEGALGAFDAALSLLDIDAPGVSPSACGGGALTKAQSILLYSECKLGTALAHFALGESDAATEVLEAALEDLDSVEGHHGIRRANLCVALGRIYFADGDEDRALGSFMDAPDSVANTAPLFVKLSLHALAIFTADTSILATVKRVSNSDSTVKYNADVTRLTTLQHLAKNDHAGALSAVTRTLHAAPWQTHNRRRVSQLLLSLPSTSSPPSDPQPSTTHLEICARFLRTRLPPGPHHESGLDRARRVGATGMIRLSTAGEQECLMGVESSVHLAPWSEEPRRKLAIVRTALAKGE